MPCPKCNHLLITEDGVVYCEECLFVVERKDDSSFDEPKTISKTKSPVKKRGRHKKRGPKRKPRYERAKGRTCSTERCGGSVLAKGVCRKCYNKKWERFRRRVRSKKLTEEKCILCSRSIFKKRLCKIHFIKVYGLEHIKFDGR